MSWNSSIQFAKLLKAYTTLSTTALTNPMIANLNMATYNINNVNTINAVAGNTLILHADSSQGIVVNTKMSIPNHPLVITNNTADDSIQIHDNISDTSIFRVDNNGNVGIKSTSSATLGHALVVNGSANITGHINVPTLPAGTNDTQVATSAFVQTAITGVKTVRNNAIQSYSFSGPSLVLSNSTPVRNVFTIPLNASFNGCNVFTFYIRTLTVISTTNSTMLQFRFYPSRTSTNTLTTTEGAMYFTVYNVPNTSTINSSPNIIWNWVPASGLISNTLYMNIDASLLLPDEISVSNVDFVFDVVGSFTTLV